MATTDVSATTTTRLTLSHDELQTSTAISSGFYKFTAVPRVVTPTQKLLRHGTLQTGCDGTVQRPADFIPQQKFRSAGIAVTVREI